MKMMIRGRATAGKGDFLLLQVWSMCWQISCVCDFSHRCKFRKRWFGVQ